MKWCYIFVVTGVIVLIAPGQVWTQGTIGIYGEPAGRTLCVMPDSPLQEYFVVYADGPPIQRIEFSAALPVECLTPLSTWISDFAMFPNTAGDSQNGIVVDFGQCLSPPIHILSILVEQPANLKPDCCPWEIGGVVASDCEGNPIAWHRTRGYLNSYACEPIQPPHTPTPADEATFVPLTANLEWGHQSGPVGCELGDVLVFSISWGTDPSDLTTLFDQGSPFPVPGGLMPDSRYYWQVTSTTYSGGVSVPGPLWSFTTEASVASEASTWGRIKALYDD